jgi:restriction endonuclease S subunit
MIVESLLIKKWRSVLTSNEKHCSIPTVKKSSPTLIEDISAIRTGLISLPEPHGEVQYLQAKHFDDRGQLIKEIPGEICAHRIPKHHFLKNGNVLFAAKGSRNFATVHRNGDPAVASTTFLVLTPDKSRVLPEFLSWVLNHSRTQERLKRHAIGSSMASISREALGKLEINLPDLVTQERVLAVVNLANKESEIRAKIAECRQSLVDSELRWAIN